LLTEGERGKRGGERWTTGFEKKKGSIPIWGRRVGYGRKAARFARPSLECSRKKKREKKKKKGEGNGSDVPGGKKKVNTCAHSISFMAGRKRKGREGYA